MPEAKPGILKKNGHVRGNSLRALDGQEGVLCAAPDFMRQVWGELAVC